MCPISMWAHVPCALCDFHLLAFLSWYMSLITLVLQRHYKMCKVSSVAMFVVENIEQMLVISLGGWTPQIWWIILIKLLERRLSILPLAAVPYEDYCDISRMFQKVVAINWWISLNLMDFGETWLSATRGQCASANGGVGHRWTMIAGRFSFTMDSYDILITHWYTFTFWTGRQITTQQHWHFANHKSCCYLSILCLIVRKKMQISLVGMWTYLMLRLICHM